MQRQYLTRVRAKHHNVCQCISICCGQLIHIYLIVTQAEFHIQSGLIDELDVRDVFVAIYEAWGISIVTERMLSDTLGIDRVYVDVGVILAARVRVLSLNNC